MSKWIATLALAAAAVVAGGSAAEAQAVRTGIFGGPRVFNGAGGPVALTPGYATGNVYGSGYASAPASFPAGYVAPYSYYAAPAGLPARIYAGDPGNFSFSGRPYGHAYDPWTWQYMSTNYSGGLLARYYYPPLGF